MKRVYLDQNVWIELSRARVGSNLAKKKFDDAYQLARYASTHGIALFVLSQTHIYETQKRQKWEKRLDIVETMVEVSRFHAIKHVTNVVPLEADFAIGTLAGFTPARPNVFGVGIESLISKSVAQLPFPRKLDLRKMGYRESFVRLAESMGLSESWDILLLAGMPPDAEDREIRATLQNVDAAFARDQAEVAAKIKAHGLKGAALEEALTQYTMIEIRHELFRAASECGVPGEALVDFMIANPEGMLRMLPSRHVVQSMYMQHAQSQKRWKPNDLHDISALGVAVPYCDAVATERHWVSMLRQRKVDVDHKTTLISSAVELVEYLAGL
jgi:hypothetical protein